MSFKTLIDADACPVTRLAESILKKYSIPCILFCDTSHVMQSDYSQVITASKGADSVDFALLSLVNANDVVITQDYGLAALCLAKGAFVINQNGMQYTNDNIDTLLTSRHINAKIRASGARHKGPKKRTKEADESFEAAFENLIQKLIKNG